MNHSAVLGFPQFLKRGGRGTHFFVFAAKILLRSGDPFSRGKHERNVVKPERYLPPVLLVVLAFQLCTTASLGQMPSLSPFPKTGTLSKPSDPDKFTFVIAGDNRPAHKSFPQPPTPSLIFSAVKELGHAAALLLSTGEPMSGKRPDTAKRTPEQYHE